MSREYIYYTDILYVWIIHVIENQGYSYENTTYEFNLIYKLFRHEIYKSE